MKIGFAKQRITPALPKQLAGYAAKRVANEVLDDVYVKVLLLEKDAQHYGLVAYDLCAIDGLLIQEVKNEFVKHGLLADHFLFTATHTHSSFGGMIDTVHGVNRAAEGIFVPTDKRLIQAVADISIQAIMEACEDLQEGRLYVAKGLLHDIGNNRNSLEYAGNDRLLAVFAEQTQGKKISIMNFACHPTVLNDQNQKISADYPGAIDAYMMQQGYAMNIFLNGSCGDISTRFSRQGSGYEEVQRYGILGGEALLALRRKAKEITPEDIIIKQLHCSLQMKQPDTIEHAKAALEEKEAALQTAIEQGVSGSALRLQESFVEGAQANLRHASCGLHQKRYDVELSIWKFDTEAFLCIPGELFSELSNPLQDEHTHVIGYANGYLGYFADGKAYDHACYEALSSPFERGEGEAMMLQLQQALNELKGR